METKRLYWAPGVHWAICEDGKLRIAQYYFSESYVILFPEFYFWTQSGIEREQLLQSYREFNPIRLKRFIVKLESLRILIGEVQTIDEIFYGQAALMPEDPDGVQTHFQNADYVAAYRRKQLDREWIGADNAEAVDFSSAILPRVYRERESCRQFDTQSFVSRAHFDQCMAVMRQMPARTSPFRHCAYPSAGGLYPLDIYCLVKDNRVEQVLGGLYGVDAKHGRLLRQAPPSRFTVNAHFFLNKPIFESSAFTLFMVYNSAIATPKYGDRAYFYGILDAGILAGTLTQMAAALGLGSCCIGEMKASAAETYLALRPEQKYLFCMEFGVPCQT